MDSLLKEVWWVDLSGLTIVKFTPPPLSPFTMGPLYDTREEAKEFLNAFINKQMGKLADAQEKLWKE